MLNHNSLPAQPCADYLLKTSQVSPGVTAQQQLAVDALVDLETPVLCEKNIQSGLRVISRTPRPWPVGLLWHVFCDRVTANQVMSLSDEMRINPQLLQHVIVRMRRIEMHHNVFAVSNDRLHLLKRAF